MRSHRPVSRSVFVISIALYFMQSALATNAYSVNRSLLIGPEHTNGRYGKYSIDDLMNGQFEYKVSDDIDMDPCKSSMYSSRRCCQRRCSGNIFFFCSHSLSQLREPQLHRLSCTSSERANYSDANNANDAVEKQHMLSSATFHSYRTFSLRIFFFYYRLVFF